MAPVSGYLRPAGQSLRAAQRGSGAGVSHAQAVTFLLPPQTGQRPRQSSRQSGFMGSARVVSVSSRAVRSSCAVLVDVGLEVVRAELVLLAARAGMGTKRASTAGWTVTV